MSPLDNLHEMSNPIFPQKLKKNIKLLSTDFSELKVDYCQIMILCTSHDSFSEHIGHLFFGFVFYKEIGCGYALEFSQKGK